jgi:putative ABC transport system ATP-binding protein
MCPQAQLRTLRQISKRSRSFKLPVLESRNVTKQVNSPDGPLTILENIDLTIEPGEAVAITGPSGSGKSTLLALLAGLDVPSQGEVRLEGQPFSQLDEDGRARARAGRVGFVFQSFHLIPSMTALENVRLPLEIAHEPQAQERAMAALADVGLSARSRYLAKQLSGGEQQRVALARAFVTRPSVLFADEPTGNLDTANGGRIANLLFELNRTYGTTLILVTHELALAQRCDRTVELVGGEISSCVSTT